MNYLEYKFGKRYFNKVIYLYFRDLSVMELYEYISNINVYEELLMVSKNYFKLKYLTGLVSSETENQVLIDVFSELVYGILNDFDDYDMFTVFLLKSKNNPRKNMIRIANYLNCFPNTTKEDLFLIIECLLLEITEHIHDSYN